MDSTDTTRLILVTPPDADPESFPAQLAEALGGGAVAAVLIAGTAGKGAEKLAATLVEVAQGAGAAALIADDTRLAGHASADGVQIGTGFDDLRHAAKSFRPKRIVGAGGLASRHDAMQAGEIGVDYVFFGRPHGDTHDSAHPKALDLAEWWSDLMEVPAVVMAGRSLESVAEAAATNSAFVAVHDAIWACPAGPAKAVALARAALAPGRRAA
jgi:thiamine-phosphate pyrophosphorylase